MLFLFFGYFSLFFFVVVRLLSSPYLGLRLLGQGSSSIGIVLVNVNGLPGVADPLVADRPRGPVAAVGDILGEGAALLLVLVLFFCQSPFTSPSQSKGNLT